MLVCRPARIQIRSNTRHHSETSNGTGEAPADTPQSTGSAKLFQDAQDDDAPRPKSSRLKTLEAQAQQGYKNWDGDESIPDAVLRMLVDKYKPLRTGKGLQSADEKMKQPGGVPDVREGAGTSMGDPSSSDSSRAESAVRTEPVKLEPTITGSWANEPLLKGDANHRPWHTTFKAPTHSPTSSIKFGTIFSESDSSPPLNLSSLHPSTSNFNSRQPSSHTPKDDKARRIEREAKKRSEHAGRLGRARESTLDYRMGVMPSMKSRVSQARRINPVTLKGWIGLVEDEIERARSKGLFNALQGHGRPLEKVQEDLNPFIGREEYLLNRIVQRNGALPPWIELQAELESSISTFRQLLRDAWTRRALRILLGSTPVEQAHTITEKRVKELRDDEWFKRERKYHETALEEVNRAVKNYNAVAPYTVRRPNYVLDTEVEKALEQCVESIVNAVNERLEEERSRGRKGICVQGLEDERDLRGQGEDKDRYGFREFMREVLKRFRLW